MSSGREALPACSHSRGSSVASGFGALQESTREHRPEATVVDAQRGPTPVRVEDRRSLVAAVQESLRPDSRCSPALALYAKVAAQTQLKGRGRRAGRPSDRRWGIAITPNRAGRSNVGDGSRRVASRRSRGGWEDRLDERDRKSRAHGVTRRSARGMEG